ncbi:hypothetical protein BURK_024995 [Burkholderia sp. SJ98]|nr:hypothetical protein BURK_024995 [Burkholderia sp. SJ98]
MLASTGNSSLHVLQAQHLGLIVVRENFPVAAPVDNRIERFLRGLVGEKVLQFLLEAQARRAMPRPLVQHLLDPRRQRHVPQQMLREHHLALLRAELREHARLRRQIDVALAHVRETEMLQHFRDREEIVHFEMQRPRDFRHVRAAVVRLGRERFDETRHQVRRDFGQPASQLQPLLLRFAHLPRGHLRVDIVDETPERRIQAIARMLERHLDLGHHAARIRRQHENAVAHEHRFLDVVRDDQHRLDRHAPLRPQIEQVGAQVFGGEHVERGERLVHQQQGRIDDQRPRETHALTHPARQFTRIRVLEAVETDQVDRGQRALAPLARGHALRFQTRFHVLQHGQPRKQREGLKHHRDALRGTAQRLVQISDFAARRLDQPGDDAQKRRLARARTSEQSDDLAFAQREIRIVEHEQFALRLVEAAAHVRDAQDFRAETRRRALGSPRVLRSGRLRSFQVLHRNSSSIQPESCFGVGV